MKNTKDQAASRVAEPVQVYLDPADQDRLARLTRQLDTNKSDVLRRGLEALEREVTDPAGHPALRLIGIGSTRQDSEEGASTTDPARDHDAVLARTEEGSWRHPEEHDGGS
jgi:Arc/MetJ-type ribon-helix-helix transcriptional regulator